MPAPAELDLLADRPLTTGVAEHNAKKRSRARKLPVDSATEESKKIIRKSTGESTPVITVRKLPDQQDDIMTGGDVTLQQDESTNQELRDPNIGNELSFEQGFREPLYALPHLPVRTDC